MFYKHWKRISLALTGFFWASCDNSSTTVAPPLYGVPPQYSSSSETQGSSSSSNDNISSSSEPMPMPVYGVQQMSCEVTSENDSTITCENGYTCIAKTDTIHISAPKCETFNGTTICPDYGINADILVKKYECDDGFTYDDKEFKKIYKDSSSSEATSSSVNESSSSEPAPNQVLVPLCLVCQMDSFTKTEANAIQKVKRNLMQQHRPKETPPTKSGKSSATALSLKMFPNASKTYRNL